MTLRTLYGVLALTAMLITGCGGGSANEHPLLSSAKGNQGALSPAARTFKAALRALAPAADTAGLAEPVPEDQVFDWAESKYPSLFPTRTDTRTLDPYRYRYYPETDLYIGIAEGVVYLLGKDYTEGKVVPVALVADFAARIVRCDQAATVDPKGNAVLPPEATDAEAPEAVDQDLGSLAALYPDLDTTTDGFYPNLPCEPSIGGTLPPEEAPSQDVADAQEFLDKFDNTAGKELLDQLLATDRPALTALPSFKIGDCFVRTEPTAASPGVRKQVDCEDASFLNPAMPFEGRDIIYVHGLQTNQLFDRISDPTGPASRQWPADSGEFLNSGGYFRSTAESYWTAHLVEHLSAPVPAGSPSPWPNAGWQWTSTDTVPVYVPKANRYLIVAWSSNQTIEYAQHALLTQIQLAMTTGLNVVTPPTYPALQVRPFCANGCIVIGHSTGPLVTSSALGRAQAGAFGPGGQQIAARVLAHVSMAGAISGSRIATVGMAVASLGAPIASASNVLCPVVDELFGIHNACNADLTFVASSILRDLIPAVAQGVWGRDVENSPVPTVTLAGGHPRGNQALGLTQWFLPGMDDGVVTMNSSCGNPNPVFPHVAPPSGLSVSQRVKAFEFSEWLPRLIRGTKLWVSQNQLMAPPPGPSYLAGACTPYLSSAGMVLPVSNDWSGTSVDTRRRYRNHYSFIQSLAEHSYDGGGSPAPAMWPSYVGGPASDLRQYAPLNATGTTEVWGINVEESRVVTDPTIYTRMLDANGTHLLKPLDMRVVERGRRIAFHMPFNIGNCVRQGTLKYYCHRWLWKRTYHLADKWENKQSSHYAYEYVGRR
jgi:hypothetical protein